MVLSVFLYPGRAKSSWVILVVLGEVLIKLLGLKVIHECYYDNTYATVTLAVMLLIYFLYTVLDIARMQVGLGLLFLPFIYFAMRFRDPSPNWLVIHYFPMGVAIVLYHLVVHHLVRRDRPMGAGDYMFHLGLGLFIPPGMHLVVYVMAQAISGYILERLKRVGKPPEFPYAVPLYIALIVNLAVAYIVPVEVPYYTPWFFVSGTLCQYAITHGGIPT
ncbi:hypothetical protein [Pyrococcus kukulkanii]|uniref:Uncharacterized protein n=1 Tax=Pyrococcus kukulkanii TaxID=1609559 RepID=A0ABV4T947_9EURY